MSGSPTTPTTGLSAGLESVVLDSPYSANNETTPWPITNPVHKKYLGDLWEAFETAREKMKHTHVRLYLDEKEKQRIEVTKLEKENHDEEWKQSKRHFQEMGCMRATFVSHRNPLSMSEKRQQLEAKDKEHGDEELQLQTRHIKALEQLNKKVEEELAEFKAVQNNELERLQVKYQDDKHMFLRRISRLRYDRYRGHV